MGSGDRSTLVRICDPAGRLRGTGFVADDRGTVVTSHEAVDGLARLVLYGTGDRSRSVGAEAITALPELDLAVALPTHREPVIGAFRDRLTRPGDGAGEALRSLAGIDAPALALHAAGLVQADADSHPDGGAHAAAYLDRRLEHGPAARALLLPLVSGLLRDRPVPAPVRGALARVLAAPGTPASVVLRVLLEVLLEFEQGAHRDPVVLDALLCAAAAGSDRRAPVRTRALVHRTGILLVRTPEGAARFDRRLVELARDVPGFAESVTGWPADAPQEWAAVVGPGARRTVEAVPTAMPMPMQGAGRGHGSLRPA